MGRANLLNESPERVMGGESSSCPLHVARDDEALGGRHEISAAII